MSLPAVERPLSYARDYLIPLVGESPGNSAYLADPGDGRMPADFVTGAVQLAADEGVTVLAAAAGHRFFARTPPEAAGLGVRASPGMFIPASRRSAGNGACRSG